MMNTAAPAASPARALAPDELRDAFLHLKETRKLRNRDVAQLLGVSEGEALAAFAGERVVRLESSFVELFEEMPRLGGVMALTRNAAAVHEKDGAFEQMSHDGPVGLALGAIDLRIFYRNWAAGFAVYEPTAHGVMKSLQFFDAQGDAVHKVYLRKHSDHAAFDAFVSRWRMPVQSPAFAVEPAPPAHVERPDGEIDAAGLRAAWDAMTDTHQFHGVVRRHGVSRTQALRLAGASRAHRVATDAARRVLERAAQTRLPIMVFVGNRGMIQIHTGTVTNIRRMGTWINVLDEDFNLHLREDLVASAWVVRKPTSDGAVTSVELFDAAGDNIAMLFGARKPGQPELAGWRELAGALPRLDTADAADAATVAHAADVPVATDAGAAR
ncbi:hemin-degrading HemS.ChuX domain protein [Burkholderia pseudomallei MSHR2451]|uniref:hemin-degrading factor n=1 Tax=Burkholderia pseudomallei TaxID=28450 RepID=UPI00016B1FAB|nr:hemin-degrading factor [Burkholderia pseudomallei]AGZ30207.1 hemin-degrading HemS.ChuX domain protein [Burkholderia pseudomallei NCTC 13179]ALJ74697.1 Hemin transport protein HemS [Burkholderia pseudomallei]APY96478.1 heme ABC transporter [Burkholderia pseudomallei]KGV58786.1 hemin-degrading HemS.ChuX domain protein [Burkholderia pseudomallei ABCPW 91]KGW28822.1 hemin-degrading HemS.ChuX domain protein [Burkholderia pseudomallei MSHR2451]